MTNKIKSWIFLSITLCYFLIQTSSCSKEVDNNIQNTVTDIDGNIYHYDTIGTQVWMVENLKTTRYRNGDPIPYISDATEWSNDSTGAYCYFENNSSNNNLYGKLYNWYAVTDRRNIAPVGWHVPSDDEWYVFKIYLINNGYDIDSTIHGYNIDSTIYGDRIAKSLASSSGWRLSDEEGSIGNKPNLNDSTGFSALPGGCRFPDGVFCISSIEGHWWSTTEWNPVSACGWSLLYNYNKFEEKYNIKKDGFSVRCLRD